MAYSLLREVKEGTQGRSLEQKNKEMLPTSLLPCSPSTFFKQPRLSCQGGIAHSGLSPKKLLLVLTNRCSSSRTDELARVHRKFPHSVSFHLGRRYCVHLHLPTSNNLIKKISSAFGLIPEPFELVFKISHHIS